MQTRSALLVLLLCVGFALPAHALLQPAKNLALPHAFHDPTGLWSMRYPDGWTHEVVLLDEYEGDAEWASLSADVEHLSDDAFDGFFSDSPAAGADWCGGVLVFQEPIRGRVTLRRAAEDFVASFREDGYHNFKIKYNARFAGRPAAVFRCDRNSDLYNGRFDAQQLRFVVWLVLHRGHLIAVGFVSEQRDAKVYADYFRAIDDSFRLN